MKYIFVSVFVAVMIMGCTTKEFNSNTSKIIDGMKDITNEGVKAINSEG